MIQVGNSGNQFKKMSISDEDVYKFALECLQKAKKVTVEYAEKSVLDGFTMRDTNYEIVGIKVPQDI